MANCKSTIQNLFLSECPGAKNQVPFEKRDLKFIMKPKAHLSEDVLDHRALLEDVLNRFLGALAP